MEVNYATVCESKFCQLWKALENNLLYTRESIKGNCVDRVLAVLGSWGGNATLLSSTCITITTRLENTYRLR